MLVQKRNVQINYQNKTHGKFVNICICYIVKYDAFVLRRDSLRCDATNRGDGISGGIDWFDIGEPLFIVSQIYGWIFVMYTCFVFSSPPRREIRSMLWPSGSSGVCCQTMMPASDPNYSAPQIR